MEIIDQVRQVSSIVEIASQYTTLRKRGRKWVGLCPFHSEKTPSFTVDEDKQLFHCFGCGAGGDVFSLVMEKENLNFPEALRSLAERYHVPLPAARGMDPRAVKLEEKLFKLNEVAAGFFKKCLHATQEGKGALEYLRKRKLSEETLQVLRVGYAPNNWTALVTFLRERNVPVSLLEKSGLVVPGRTPGEYHDRFRGRVIFPIFSLTGKVVAFGGRTIFDAQPKYLNSPDTPLYSKGKLLYGLNFTKDAVRDAGEAVLVEGYTDFSALYQAGVRNVAASLGTALTPWQVAQLQRFAGRVVVNYDGDAAGRNAIARAVPMFLEKGVAVRALLLPDDQDPDGYIRAQGAERYLGLMKRAADGLGFLVEHHSQGARLEVPEEKARVARAVLKDIEAVPDPLVRSGHLQRLGDLLRYREEELRALVQSPAPAPKSAPERAPLSPGEKRLLQIVCEDRSVAAELAGEAAEDVFRGLPSEPVFLYILECGRAAREWSFPELKGRVPAELYAQISRVLLEPTPAGSAAEARECLDSIRELHYQRRRREIQAELARAERSGDRDKILSLLYQKQDLTKKQLALKRGAPEGA